MSCWSPRPPTAALRRVLIEVNARIRAAGSPSLLVYCSGHSDAEALHLGRTRFPWLRFATRIKSLKERLLEAGWINASALVFDSARALERIQRLGDLFAPVLALSQRLPRRPHDSLLRSRARKP